jgi:hypothetical protein
VAIIADPELVEHDARDDRRKADDTVDVVGRVDFARGVEFRTRERIAVLAAVVVLRITAKNLLVGRKLMVDLLIPAITVKAAAAIDELQIVRRAGAAGGARQVRRVPDVKRDELGRDRIEPGLGNDIARQRVADESRADLTRLKGS